MIGRLARLTTICILIFAHQNLAAMERGYFVLPGPIKYSHVLSLSDDPGWGLFKEGSSFTAHATKSKIGFDQKSQQFLFGTIDASSPKIFFSGIRLKDGVTHLDFFADDLESSYKVAFAEEKQTIALPFGKPWRLTQVIGADRKPSGDKILATESLFITDGKSQHEVLRRDCVVPCRSSWGFMLFGDLDGDSIPDISLVASPTSASNDPAWRSIWLSKTKSHLRFAGLQVFEENIKNWRVSKNEGDVDQPKSIRSPSLVTVGTQFEKIGSLTTDQEYFALHQSVSGWQLTKTKIWAIEDSGGEYMMVEPRSIQNALVLLKGLTDIQEGPVTGRAYPAPDVDQAFHPVEFSIGNRKYKILMVPKESEESSAQMALTDGKARWMLPVFIQKSPDQRHAPTVLWTGDMNRNGKADILLSVPGYESSSTRLFLDPEDSKSSVAKATAEF